MKKTILIALAFSVISSISCQAQDSDFSKTLVRANKQTYSTNELFSHHKYINNINNHFYKGKGPTPPNALPVEIKDKKYDHKLVAQIFYEAFIESRLKKLANENLDLQISYAVDHQGNILEISFSFSDKSTLTPVEIETLETRLKKEVKFTLNNKVFKGYEYIPITSFVNFKRLVNHSNDAVQ